MKTLRGLFVIATLYWGCLTLAIWLGGSETLVEVLKVQLRFVAELMRRIY